MLHEIDLICSVGSALVSNALRYILTKNNSTYLFALFGGN